MFYVVSCGFLEWKIEDRLFKYTTHTSTNNCEFVSEEQESTCTVL